MIVWPSHKAGGNDDGVGKARQRTVEAVAYQFRRGETVTETARRVAESTAKIAAEGAIPSGENGADGARKIAANGPLRLIVPTKRSPCKTHKWCFSLENAFCRVVFNSNGYYYGLD